MAKGPEGNSEEGATKGFGHILAAGALATVAAFGVHGIHPQRADAKATCDSLATGEPLTDIPFTFSPTINLFHPIKAGTFLREDALAAQLDACRSTHDIQASVACAAASINKTVAAGGKIPANLAAEAAKTKSECKN